MVDIENNNELLTDIISKNVLLPGESKKNLNKLKEKIEKDLNPVGALEEILCSKIISDTWKMQRLYRFETQILLEQQKQNRSNRTAFSSYDYLSNKARPVPNSKTKRFRSTIKQIAYTKELEEIQRHISVLENGMLKTVAELSSLQKIRLQK